MWLLPPPFLNLWARDWDSPCKLMKTEGIWMVVVVEGVMGVNKDDRGVQRGEGFRQSHQPACGGWASADWGRKMWIAAQQEGVDGAWVAHSAPWTAPSSLWQPADRNRKHKSHQTQTERNPQPGPTRMRWGVRSHLLLQSCCILRNQCGPLWDWDGAQKIQPAC